MPFIDKFEGFNVPDFNLEKIKTILSSDKYDEKKIYCFNSHCGDFDNTHCLTCLFNCNNNKQSFERWVNKNLRDKKLERILRR